MLPARSGSRQGRTSRPRPPARAFRRWQRISMQRAASAQLMAIGCPASSSTNTQRDRRTRPSYVLPADFVCRKSVGRGPFRLCRSPGSAHLVEGLRCDGASSRTEGERSVELSPFMSAITCRVRMCQLPNVAISGSSGTAARRRGEPRHRAMRRGARPARAHRCRNAGTGRPGSFTARTVLRAGTSDSRMDAAAWSRLSSG